MNIVRCHSMLKWQTIKHWQWFFFFLISLPLSQIYSGSFWEAESGIIFKWRCIWLPSHPHQLLWKKAICSSSIQKGINKNPLYVTICFTVSGFKFYLSVTLANLIIKILENLDWFLQCSIKEKFAFLRFSGKELIKESSTWLSIRQDYLDF